MSLLRDFLLECISMFPLVVAYCVFLASGVACVAIAHLIIHYCWFVYPDWVLLFAVCALVAYLFFFRLGPMGRARRVIRMSMFLGLIPSFPVLPAHIGTSEPLQRIPAKVVHRPQTHCRDICEVDGLGPLRIAEKQSSLVRLESVQHELRNFFPAPTALLTRTPPRRASLLRPMTTSKWKGSHLCRMKFSLGDSVKINYQAPESKEDSSIVHDTQMEDLVEQFASLHLCSDPVSPPQSLMSLDSYDETPFLVEPIDVDASAGLADANVVPLFMPVDAVAVLDEDVVMMEGGGSGSSVVVDVLAPGNVQQENYVNLQQSVEPDLSEVDPGVVLTASGLAPAYSMRMTSGLATASMSVTSELASAFTSPVVDNVTSASELVGLASASSTPSASGSTMQMTSGLASASMSSGFGLATASTDLASGSATRKTSGSAMSEGFGRIASGSASASSMRMTSGLATASMSSASGLAPAAFVPSSEPGVSVADRSI
ncbi:hypothetical protein BDA99DRAFT_530444 [Phascolomyces articulosus]|uniref:Uncharacterized protein n=1 Tax=Phascolomyces articulosus TaxID=60185 RepID=A0AAD5JV75_9FUNG|nr:hypothetical protein BDA99DRAFT_530444 [Phascolomyces articulosus]